jgi:hypothetical protein
MIPPSAVGSLLRHNGARPGTSVVLLLETHTKQGPNRNPASLLITLWNNGLRMLYAVHIAGCLASRVAVDVNIADAIAIVDSLVT